jgi:Uma2 family endonuclease
MTVRTVLLGEPPVEVQAWLERRRALGQDLFDEVWEGEHHVAPAPHRRHGDVDDQLTTILRPKARAAGLWLSGPLNIGTPDNYRVPDRAYLRTRESAAFTPTAAIVVEIVSPGDETRSKLGFYFAAGVEQLLVVDPEIGGVEWWTRGADGFVASETSALLDMTTAELRAAIDWPG